MKTQDGKLFGLLESRALLKLVRWRSQEEGYFGLFWPIPAYFEPFLAILNYSRLFWSILAHLGSFSAKNRVLTEGAFSDPRNHHDEGRT